MAADFKPIGSISRSLMQMSITSLKGLMTNDGGRFCINRVCPFVPLQALQYLSHRIQDAMKWLFLTLAIVFEVFGTTAMKLADGFKQPWWAVAMIVGYTLCFYFLTLALRDFDLSVVYAVWSGLGIVLLTAIGIFFFSESVNVWKMVCIALILIGVVGLNLGTKHV